MKKSEVLEHFLEHEVRAASCDFVAGAMSRMRKETKKETVQDFVSDFGILFEECGEQENRNGTQIRYIQLSLVRSKALTGDPFYILEAFGPEYYLSEPATVREPGLTWLYEEYDRFCKEIERQGKRYFLGINELDLNRIKLAELTNCNRIVRHLFEESVVYMIHSDAFRNFGSGKKLGIHMGEYRGPFEKIFETDEYTERIGRWWYGIL